MAPNNNNIDFFVFVFVFLNIQYCEDRRIIFPVIFMNLCDEYWLMIVI
jgi:hypothetical protein